MIAAARIDWGQGRVVGYAVPEQASEAHSLVEICVDGLCVHSVVADQPLLPLQPLLAGLPWPQREDTAFALRLPAARLLPGMLGGQPLQLTLRKVGQEPFFEAVLQGAQQLLQLSDGLPLDQRHTVRFAGLADGTVLRGDIVNRHGPGVPVLQVRVNEGSVRPLALVASAADGLSHGFEVPLAQAGLTEGHNVVQVQTTDGQPLARYPIHIGPAGVGETEHRVAALEAQVAFLKHLALAQDSGQAGQMAQLKADLVRLCSDMLALQRANLEREWAAARQAR